MQEFFKTTLVSTYIKYLLANTPLPLYPTIRTGDYIVKGLKYIYKTDLIECTQTGFFRGIKPDFYKQDYLTPSDNLFVTDDDFIVKHYQAKGIEGERWRYLDDEATQIDAKRKGGLTVTDDVIRLDYLPVGKTKVLQKYFFRKSYNNITSCFNSTVDYYDSETHKVLGNYLRALRDIEGIDLMSLYNCFDYTVVNNVDISNNSIEDKTSSNTKTILVPVRFNRQYTIALDCPFKTYICPVLYNGKTLIDDIQGKDQNALFLNDLQTFNNLQFSNPITKTILVDIDRFFNYDKINQLSSEVTIQTEVDKASQSAAQFLQYEKYLYLAIQIPSTLQTSVVVLEGNYANIAAEYITSAQKLNSLSDVAISSIFISSPSLLEVNDRVQKPFSDKLIAYLLEYTIDSREYIDENVFDVEKSIGYYSNDDKYYHGTWNVGLRYQIQRNYQQLSKYPWMRKKDIIGFVDNDVEDALNRNILKIMTLNERGLKPINERS